MEKFEKLEELASDIYWQAVDPENTQEDIDRFADALIDTEVVKYYGAFARDVKGAPVEKLAKATAESGNGRYIYQFAEDVPNAPIDILAEGLMNCNENDAKWVRWFAYEFEDRGAPKDKLMAKYRELDNVSTQ